MDTSRKTVVLAIFCGAVGFTQMRLDELDGLESVRLISRVREVQMATQNGLCPEFEVYAFDRARLGVSVRAACQGRETAESNLVGSYLVDPRRGEVFTLGGEGAVLSLTSAEKTRLRQRRVTSAEATCIAKTAFAEKEGAGDVQVSSPEVKEEMAWVEVVGRARGVKVSSTYTVDLSTGNVGGDGGSLVRSANVNRLIKAIWVLHKPQGLTLSEAGLLARSALGVDGDEKIECSAITSGRRGGVDGLLSVYLPRHGCGLVDTPARPPYSDGEFHVVLVDQFRGVVVDGRSGREIANSKSKKLSAAYADLKHKESTQAREVLAELCGLSARDE